MLKAFGHVLAALGVAALAAGGLAADDAVLRVCADPDNLPFSAAAGTERGLYVDLAELVAARLGARTEYTWWHTAYGQRAVRNTLLTDRCDVFFGLPNDPRFMGRQIDLTRPFMDVGYAVVVPPSFKLSRLEDLKAVTVAVQFRSEPQIMLASRDGFRVSTFRLVEEAMDALAKGEPARRSSGGPRPATTTRRVFRAPGGSCRSRAAGSRSRSRSPFARATRDSRRASTARWST